MDMQEKTKVIKKLRDKPFKEILYIAIIAIVCDAIDLILQAIAICAGVWFGLYLWHKWWMAFYG